MLKKIIIFLFLQVLFLSNITYAKEIEITAEEFIVDNDQGYYVAKGNVVSYFEGYTIFSDSILYDKKTEMIYIDGNFKLINDFLGLFDGLKYDLKKKEGYINKGDLFYFSQDKKKQKFISGENIVIFDKHNFFLSKGTISSCEGEHKPWYIKANDIDITLGDYLTAKNVTLYGANIPLVYSPYFLVPIKKEKESGFLFPTFGYSGKNGFMMELPYYFFLHESYDDTLSLKVRSENTIGFDNEFRYRLSKNEEGLFNISLYNNFHQEKDYFFINFKHSKNNSLKADLSLINRPDFFYDYSNDTYLKSLPYLRSLAFYETVSYRALYSLDFLNLYDINLQERDFTSFTLNRVSFPISFNNIFYNIDASLSYLNKGSDDFARIFISPYGMYSFSRDTYDLSLKLYGDITYYKELFKEEEKRAFFIINPEAQIHMSYLIDNIYIARNSLKITSFLPFIKIDNISFINDRRDFFNKSKRVELSLEEDFIKQDDGKLLYNFKISQDYFLDDDYQSERFSDLKIQLRTFLSNLTLTLIGDYNHKRGDLTSLFFYSDYKSEILNFNLNYNKSFNISEFANMSISKKFKDTLNIGLLGRFDIKENILKETGLILDYLKNCYSIKLDFRNRKEPSDFVFFLYINLYGLGEIKFE